VNQAKPGDAAFDAWLATGYAAAIVKMDQGNMTSDQFRGIAKLASAAGDGKTRVTIDQNLLLACIPLAQLPQVYAALQPMNLAEAGAEQIDDVVTNFRMASRRGR
jgi:sulfite reductase beta subunit-like hemoprotein